MGKKRTFEDLHERALKYTTRADFQKMDNSAYQASRKSSNHNKICAHMEPPKTKAYSLEEIQADANKYSNRMDFQKYSRKTYDAAYKRHDFDNICKHMSPSKTRAYSLEEIQTDANKYETRWKFQKQSPGTYQAAKRAKILDQVCKHMSSAHIHWTDKDIQELADKCSTRTEFSKRYPKAYDMAHHRKILDIVCKHMKILSNTSIAETHLFDLIKTVYPSTKKLIVRKIKIYGKDYITGFDIDIYIKELNKGIEFDGMYWHSKAGLKRKRKHWPDEDIENYHQIKDNYFLSQGIQILHIKEGDWILDKEKCIKRCLKFLSDDLCP